MPEELVIDPIQITYILATAITILSGKILYTKFWYNRGKKAGEKKSCVHRIEEKVDSITETVGKKVESSDDTHHDLYSKISTIEKIVAKHEGYFELLLNHFKIPFNKD